MLTNNNTDMNIYYRLIALISLCIVYSGNIHAQFDDGVYYILNTSTDMYLGSTGFNGAKAILIKHGHPFVFTRQADIVQTQSDDIEGEEAGGEAGLESETKPHYKYVIDSHIFSSETNHYLGSHYRLDEESVLWSIEESTDGNYVITCDGHNYLACDGASTTVTTITNATNRRAHWKIIKEEDRVNAFKPEDDATFLIRNADFCFNFGPGYQESFWVINSASDARSVTLSGGSNMSPCGIANHTTFDVSQDVEGIPCGTYALQAQCFYRLDGTRTSYIPELYLDDESELFHLGSQKEANDGDASKSFGLNLYDVKGLKTTTYCGKIVVGTRLERSEKLRSYWDNFTLKYLGDLDLDGYKKAYVESIRETELTLGKDMNKAIKDSIEVVLQFKDTVNMTIESIKPYINILNKIRAEGNKSARYYAKVMEAYDRYATLDEGGQEIYKELAADIMESYDNGLITNGKKEIAALDSIYLIALKSQITPGTDMTAAIVNPEVNGDTGWTCDKPYGGNGPMLNDVSFEYWAGSSIKLENRSFNYRQTIAGLQNGRYTVSCMAYNSKSSNDTEFYPSCGLYAFNGQDTVKVVIETEGSKLQEYTTPEIEAIDNTLTIGVRNFTTMPARWFVADDFRLTLVSPDPALGIDDAACDDTVIVGIYSMDGIRRNELQHGVNIVRYRGGKVKKVIK